VCVLLFAAVMAKYSLSHCVEVESRFPPLCQTVITFTQAQSSQD